MQAQARNAELVMYKSYIKFKSSQLRAHYQVSDHFFVPGCLQSRRRNLIEAPQRAELQVSDCSEKPKNQDIKDTVIRNENFIDVSEDVASSPVYFFPACMLFLRHLVGIKP